MPMREELSEQIIRQCVDTYNKCSMEWLDKFYAQTVEWDELPTQAIPQGRKGNIDALRRATEFALNAFPNRQMKIRTIISKGKNVAVELDWWGTASRQLGIINAGDVSRIRIASFFEVTNDRITKHTDYCITEK